MTQELIIDIATAKRSTETAEIMRRYNDVFQRHDPSALDDLVAEDCVIENTAPAPEGARRIGKAACSNCGRQSPPDPAPASTSKRLSWRATGRRSAGASGWPTAIRCAAST
jgi:hypothetical protein